MMMIAQWAIVVQLSWWAASSRSSGRECRRAQHRRTQSLHVDLSLHGRLATPTPQRLSPAWERTPKGSWL